MRENMKLTLAVFIVLVAGCQKKQYIAEENVSTRSYKITISEGGGITGLVSGYTLHADGSEEYWQRFPGKPDSILWKKQHNPEEIDKFEQDILENELTKLAFQESGNMTTTLTYENSDTSFVWFWKGGDASGIVPAKLINTYQKLKKYCSTEN